MFSSSVFAQSYGVRVGAGSTSQFYQISGQDFFTTTDFKLGLQGGVQVDIPIADNFDIETGLFATTKGAKGEKISTANGVTFTTTAEIDLIFLNLPIQGRYGFSAGENTTIYVAAGPFLGFALKGESDSKTTAGGVVVQEVVTDLEPTSNKIDFGVGFGVGALLGDIQVGLGYDLGLVNLSKTTGEDSKTRSLGLFVTYKFNSSAE